MTSFEKDIRVLKPIFILFTLLVVLVVLFVTYFARGLFLEEYCSQTANKRVPKELQNELYPVIKVERQQIPGFEDKNSSISGIYREILKCEREQKPFFIL